MSSQRLTAEEMFRRIWCGQFIPSNHWQKAMIDLIQTKLNQTRAEGYESARKDLVAIHSAKWSKEDHVKGYSEGLEAAARHIEKDIGHWHKCYPVLAKEIRALKRGGREGK